MSITATVVDAGQLRDLFQTDFANQFTVLEVRVEPKGGKPVDIRLDDFLLRSESSGTHGGPFAASQIAGEGEIVVHRVSEGPKDKKGKTTFGGPVFSPGEGAGAPHSGEIDGARNEVKDEAKADPALDQLKAKILAEKTVTEPVSGLLFFPLEKEKPKNLVLTYTSPTGKLKITFK